MHDACNHAVRQACHRARLTHHPHSLSHSLHCCCTAQNRLDELRATARDRHAKREADGLSSLANADYGGERGLFATIDLNNDSSLSMTEVGESGVCVVFVGCVCAVCVFVRLCGLDVCCYDPHSD